MDSYTNRLTLHVCVIANGPSVCFCWGLFYRPSGVLVYAGGHQGAVACQNRKTTGWEWPHYWIVISATDLASFCGIFSTIGHQLGPITITVKFVWRWSHPKPPPATPWQMHLWYWWKKLSKMAGSSASRPLKTMPTETPCIAIQSWRIA